MSERRKRSLIHQEEWRNLRTEVEATVRQVKYPFPASKLPMRGKFRISCLVIGSAMIKNVQGVQCYLEVKIGLEVVQDCSQELDSSFLFSQIRFFVINRHQE